MTGGSPILWKPPIDPIISFLCFSTPSSMPNAAASFAFKARIDLSRCGIHPVGNPWPWINPTWIPNIVNLGWMEIPCKNGWKFPALVYSSNIVNLALDGTWPIYR